MDSPGGSLDESLTTGMVPDAGISAAFGSPPPSDPNAAFFHDSLNSWSSLTFLAVMSAVWALKSLLPSGWFDGGEDLEAHLEYFQNWVCVGIPSLLVFLSASSVGAFFDACWSVYDVDGAWWGFYSGGGTGGPLGETTRSRGASSRGTVDHLSGMNAIANLNSTLLSDATQNRLREHLRAQQDVLFRERHKSQFVLTNAAEGGAEAASTNNAKSVRGLVFLAALFFLTEKGKSAVQRIARTLRTSWRGLAEDSSPAEATGGEPSSAGRQDVLNNDNSTGATTTSFGEADDLTHSTSAAGSASGNPGEMRAGQTNHGDHDATPVSWKSRKIKAAFHASTTSTPTVENLGQSLRVLVHYLRRGHETVINGDLYGIFRRLAIVIVILRQPSAWINIALPSQLLDSLYQLLFPSSSGLIAEQWGNIKLKWWQEKLDWCLFSMHFVKIVQFWLFLLRHNGDCDNGGSDWLSAGLGFVWVWQLWLSFYDDTFSKARSN